MSFSRWKHQDKTIKTNQTLRCWFIAPYWNGGVSFGRSQENIPKFLSHCHSSPPPPQKKSTKPNPNPTLLPAKKAQKLLGVKKTTTLDASEIPIPNHRKDVHIPKPLRKSMRISTTHSPNLNLLG